MRFKCCREFSQSSSQKIINLYANDFHGMYQVSAETAFRHLRI